MTAADRPPVTDDARAEAERRYGWMGDMPTNHDPFTAGAEWAAGRAETWDQYVPIDLVHKVVNRLMRGGRDDLILANEVNTLLGASARRRVAARRSETTTEDREYPSCYPSLGEMCGNCHRCTDPAETTTDTTKETS